MNQIAPFPKPEKAKKRPDGKDPWYLGQIHELPCVICQAFGFIQTLPTTAHHPICGRYSGKKTPDRMAIPLCDCHHQGLRFDRDRNKLAIHDDKELWAKKFGPDTDYISTTQDRILG